MPYSANDLIRHILDETVFLVAEASSMSEFRSRLFVGLEYGSREYP
jgi:hypothetical protein